jgi:hypothetical protein
MGKHYYKHHLLVICDYFYKRLSFESLIKPFQFNEDDILSSVDSSSQSRTLLGRLEDGRIIISQSGDHVATVAMVNPFI